MAAQTRPVSWGILGAARIADSAILPALRASPVCEARAIAARDLGRAQALAQLHAVPKAYGGYEALLADPQIEAVYIALPNHLHIEWTRRAAAAGKHVLLEKPGALRAAEYAALDGIDPALKIAEAFMVRHQPRWVELRAMLRSGRFGAAKTFSSLLSFHMTNPDDFRWNPQWGGGAYYDLGCYTTMAARYVFDAEPKRALAFMETTASGVDVVTSAILDFGAGRRAGFTVSVVQAAAQTLEIVCEGATIALPQAYVPSCTEPNRILIDTAADLSRSIPEAITFAPLDQYEAEVTNFARAVRGEDAVFFGLADARANAAVADAVFAAARSGTWAEVAGA
ncbi:MAG: Gfo/Idh/MocA family protein [Acetobacteraceae bacterium]